MRFVLTAFGNRVGFAPTLAESLDQTFGGDSAAKVAGGDQSTIRIRAVAINKTRLKVSPPSSLLRHFKMLTKPSKMVRMH